MILTVIPARGSSKGIPRKNLEQINGVSLLGMALNVAHELNYPMIVSTDDPDVASEARKYTESVTFAYPPECHGDHSTALDVWSHAWLAAEKAHMNTYEVSVYLEPSSPMRTSKHVEDCIELLMHGRDEAVWTVEPVPSRYAPPKQLLMDRMGDTGFVRFATADGETITRRQDIAQTYIRNGLCYAARRKLIVGKKRMYGDVMGLVTESAISIDTPADLEEARARLAR